MLKYRDLYIKYKNKYVNLKKKMFKMKYVTIPNVEVKESDTMESFCRDIYTNPKEPINALLINMQRHDDLGYITPECMIYDRELKLEEKQSNQQSINHLINHNQNELSPDEINLIDTQTRKEDSNCNECGCKEYIECNNCQQYSCCSNCHDCTLCGNDEEDPEIAHLKKHDREDLTPEELNLIETQTRNKDDCGDDDCGGDDCGEYRRCNECGCDEYINCNNCDYYTSCIDCTFCSTCNDYGFIYLPFGFNLGFLQTYNHLKKEMIKSIDFLLLLKNTLSDIIREFNDNKSNIEYIKKNTGLTMILENCVVRIMSYNKFTKIKALYDLLTQEITEENKENIENFEKIHKIYTSEDHNIVFVVSEKLIPVYDFEAQKISPKIRELPEYTEKDEATIKDEIYKKIATNRSFLHNHGIIHADLSLDNTGLRESDGKIVIFDFDMSYVHSGLVSEAENLDKIRGYER